MRCEIAGRVLLFWAISLCATSASATTLTFDISSVGTFIVPTGVTSISFKIWGAGGAANGAGGPSGGGGGFTSGELFASPGDQLNIHVGYGGYSDEPSQLTGFSTGIPAVSEQLIALAGGGGGAGNSFTSPGGAGGGAAGDAALSSRGGGGGTQTNGGIGGTTGGTAGQAFSYSWSANGGDGTSVTFMPAGPGGSGYFGGGGGGRTGVITTGGGGGGSGFLAPGVLSGVMIAGVGAIPPNTSDTHYLAGVGIGGTPGQNAGFGGNGLIVINYVVPEPSTLALSGIGGLAMLVHSVRRRSRAV